MLKLKFHPDLYIGQGINLNKLEKLKWNLRFLPQKTSVYLITFSTNSKDQCDIYYSKNLKNKYLQKNVYTVLGIAKDNHEALSLIENITIDCFKHRGDACIKQFLLAKM